MDPRVLTAEHWDLLSRALNHLYLFTGLSLNSALALLLGHAIMPSLASTADVSGPVQRFRWALYLIFAVSFGLTIYALARAIHLSVIVIDYYYPRFWI